MEKQQQEYIRKVKFKVIQPRFMCSGRDEVTAYYRGKVIEENEKEMQVQLKYKGSIIYDRFDKETNEFDKEYLKDLVLYKQ